MKQLSKAALTERDQLSQELTAHSDDLVAAIEVFNQVMRDQWEAVEAALVHYNMSIANAQVWCEEQREEIEGYYEERSAKWQESGPGQAYEAWLSAFRYVNLEEIILRPPEPITLEDSDQACILDDIPGAPE